MSENIPRPTLSDIATHPRFMEAHAELSEDPSFADVLSNSHFPSSANLPNSPVARMMEQIMFHGDVAALAQLDHYLMQFDLLGLSNDKIAKELDVSVPAARRFMNDYRNRLARQIEKLDAVSYMGESLTALKLMRSKFFQKFCNPLSTFSEQCLSADRILNIEKTKYKVLEASGFLGKRTFAGDESEDFAPRKEANYLSDMLRNLLEGNDMENDKFYKDTAVDIPVE